MYTKNMIVLKRSYIFITRFISIFIYMHTFVFTRTHTKIVSKRSLKVFLLIQPEIGATESPSFHC